MRTAAGILVTHDVAIIRFTLFIVQLEKVCLLNPTGRKRYYFPPRITVVIVNRCVPERVKVCGNRTEANAACIGVVA